MEEIAREQPAANEILTDELNRIIRILNRQMKCLAENTKLASIEKDVCSAIDGVRADLVRLGKDLKKAANSEDKKPRRKLKSGIRVAGEDAEAFVHRVKRSMTSLE